MSIRLLILRSGEDVIADVKEMTVNEKVVGYYLDSPHRCKLIADKEMSGDVTYNSRIQIIPWMPLSKSKVIPVVSDWVVSIVEPMDELRELFEKRFEEINEAQSTSDAEQSYLVDPD